MEDILAELRRVVGVAPAVVAVEGEDEGQQRWENHRGVKTFPFTITAFPYW